MPGHRQRQDRMMKQEDKESFYKLNNLPSKENSSFFSNRWQKRETYINSQERIISKGKRDAVLTNRDKIIN
jgi:hypothetical protein